MLSKAKLGATFLIVGTNRDVNKKILTKSEETSYNLMSKLKGKGQILHHPGSCLLLGKFVSLVARPLFGLGEHRIHGHQVSRNRASDESGSEINSQVIDGMDGWRRTQSHYLPPMNSFRKSSDFGNRSRAQFTLA